jgi:hypothetical protein
MRAANPHSWAWRPEKRRTHKIQYEYSCALLSAYIYAPYFLQNVSQDKKKALKQRIFQIYKEYNQCKLNNVVTLLSAALRML